MNLYSLQVYNDYILCSMSLYLNYTIYSQVTTLDQYLCYLKKKSIIRLISSQETTMRLRRLQPTNITTKICYSKVDSLDSYKNITNSLESRNLREYKKYYSNTKKSTLIRILQHSNCKQKAYKKYQLYSKSIL